MVVIWLQRVANAMQGLATTVEIMLALVNAMYD